MDYLVDMLRAEESDHEDLTAPLLVIASVSKEEFKPRQLQKYTYEVCALFYVLILLCYIRLYL